MESLSLDSLSISDGRNSNSSHSDEDDGVIMPNGEGRRCYIRINQFPGSELTKREALYLQFDVIYQRMTQALAELSAQTGMPITQENGQRRFGPPVDYDGPPPQKGSEIFVGKLPRDIYESELVPVFERAGNIFELRLMMDFSGTNRGYCFVQYYTAEEAANAIQLLNEYEIRPGRFIGVVKSVDNCRLFIGGIPRDKSKEDICEEIKKITEGVVRVIANPSPLDRTKNRGYAFIEYENHRAAAMARRKLIPGKIMMWGANIAVDWAEPEPDVDPSIMSKVMNLYVRNVPASMSEEDLLEIFNLHSQNGVEKVKKIKDFAFIHFLSRPQADEAMHSLDGTEIDGSVLEICLAKPVNKVVHRARKDLAKQLYSRNGNGNNNNGKGHFGQGTSSAERIFGQYNSLSCYNNPAQMVYQQMPQQGFHHGGEGHLGGNLQSFQYQNQQLIHEPLIPPVGSQSYQYQPMLREQLTPPRPIQPFQYQNGPVLHEQLTPPLTCYLFHSY